MKLEDDILALEKAAEDIVSSARQEAKKILATYEARKAQIREETAARVEREKARIREECAAKARDKHAELARDRARVMAALEATRREKARGCARRIVAQLLRV